MQNHTRDVPSLGQESVWDYPRPPKIELSGKRILVIFGGRVVADSTRAFKCMERSHPPTYYIPAEDIGPEYLTDSDRVSVCEYKGGARYFDVHVGDMVAQDAAWHYPTPKAPYGALAGHVAFYAQKMDECSVDGEMVQPQPGTFYGGWITSDIAGPFKGASGTLGW
ncbi:MAG: DUF427 domain-containing protein [Coriobacteriia bacterium]|nr:DUF427 domain-containing protein [Coriobacteriia bacterium]